MLKFTHQSSCSSKDDLVEAEAIQRGRRAVGSFPIVRMWIGPSCGATCEVCGHKIAVADIEYEIFVANGQELRLDAECWRLLRKESCQRRQDAQTKFGHSAGRINGVVSDNLKQAG